MTTPIYRIAEKDPVFPCYMWCTIVRPFTGKPYGWEKHYTHPGRAFDHESHWSPDAPEAPKDAPTTLGGDENVPAAAGSEMPVIQSEPVSRAAPAPSTEATPIVLGHPATAEWCKAVDEHYKATEEEWADCRTQLATAKEEMDRTYKKCTGRDYMHLPLSEAVWAVHEKLEADLAKANAAVEEANGKLGGAIMFGQLGGRLITRIMEAADMSLPDATDVELQLVRMLSELASLRAQLTAQQSVPPEARAVEAEKILTAQLALPPDKRDWNEVHRAALSLRTVNPPGEGTGPLPPTKEETADYLAHERADLIATIERYEAFVRKISEEKGEYGRLGYNQPTRLALEASAILKHAPRPTAARECGAGEAVRKAAEEIAGIANTVQGMARSNRGIFPIEVVAILRTHGLGVSEDTARLDWLEKNIEPGQYLEGESGNINMRALFRFWGRIPDGTPIGGNIGTVRAAIDAARAPQPPSP